MIDAHNMMSGYNVLRGSLLYHIPMFIAMSIFIRIPAQEYMELAFPEEANWAIYWYWTALGLHVYLSSI